MKQVIVNHSIVFILPETYEEFINKIVEKTKIPIKLLIIKYKNKDITKTNYCYLFEDELNVVSTDYKLIGGNNYPSFNSLLSSFIKYFIFSIIISITIIKSIGFFFNKLSNHKLDLIPDNRYSFILITMITTYVVSVILSLLFIELKASHCPGYKKPSNFKIIFYIGFPFILMGAVLILEKIISDSRITLSIMALSFLIFGSFILISTDNSLKKYEDEKIPVNMKEISTIFMIMFSILLFIIASPLLFNNENYSTIMKYTLFIIVMGFSLISSLPTYLSTYFHYIASPLVTCPQ